MMSSLWTNLRFEIISRKRMISTYLYFGLMMLLPALLVMATVEP